MNIFDNMGTPNTGNGRGGSGRVNPMENGTQRRITCSDSALDKAELMHKIQALCFAKTETELYLDGHPDAAPALEYYKELLKGVAALTEEYEAKYGPITAGGVNGERWTWVEGKWPWQYDREEDL